AWTGGRPPLVDRVSHNNRQPVAILGWEPNPGAKSGLSTAVRWISCRDVGFFYRKSVLLRSKALARIDSCIDRCVRHRVAAVDSESHARHYGNDARYRSDC